MRREHGEDATPLAASTATRVMPVLDVGLAALAAAIWYLRPQETAAPLIAVCVAWLLRWIVYGEPTRSTRLDFPLLLFLASAYVAASISFNQDPRWRGGASPLFWAWAKYWTLIASVALFYAVANLRRVPDVWAFAAAYALLGVAVTLYFIFTNDWSRASKSDLLTQIGAWLSEPAPEIEGRRLHPNVVGGIGAMVFPFSVVCLVRARRHVVSLGFWVAVALVSIGGIALSASRGAWFALLLVLLVWALANGTGALARGRTLRRLALLGIALFALVAVAAAVLDTGMFGTLAVAPVPGAPGSGAGSVLGRVSLWQTALSLAQDYAFTGAGLGAMAMILSTYGLLVPVYYLPHAHNVFLNVAVEQGAVGVTAFVWILGATAFLAWQFLRRRAGSASARSASPLVQAACASLGVMLMHGMVDDVPYGSRALLLLFVPSAVIVAATAVDARSRHVALPWRGIAPAALLILFSALWQRESLLGIWQANLGAVAQAEAELASYEAPERIPEIVRRTANLENAIANYQDALRYDAANRTAHERLAMIALARGEYYEALIHAEAAWRLAPTSVATRVLLADATLASGRSDEAYELWRQVSDAPQRLELTASLRYDKLNDRSRAEAARALAKRLREEYPPAR